MHRPRLQATPLWFSAQYAFNASLAMTSVTSNTILSSTSSLFTYGLAVLLLHERFTHYKLLCIVGCIMGTVLVTLSDVDLRHPGARTQSAVRGAPWPYYGSFLFVCLRAACAAAAGARAREGADLPWLPPRRRRPWRRGRHAPAAPDAARSAPRPQAAAGQLWHGRSGQQQQRAGAGRAARPPRRRHGHLAAGGLPGAAVVRAVWWVCASTRGAQRVGGRAARAVAAAGVCVLRRALRMHKCVRACALQRPTPQPRALCAQARTRWSCACGCPLTRRRRAWRCSSGACVCRRAHACCRVARDVSGPHVARAAAVAPAPRVLAAQVVR